MTLLAMAFWRRLDVPGHDACWLDEAAAGFRLRGRAVFRGPTGPAGITYMVECDRDWRTLFASIKGFAGARSLDYVIAREGAGWQLDRRPVPGLDGLADLDLGFTPATNLLQLKRVPIAAGETVALPVAWFDLETASLRELPQTYERRSADTLWYSAPSLGYQGLLELAPSGFIRRYPDLWQAED